MGEVRPPGRREWLVLGLLVLIAGLLLARELPLDRFTGRGGTPTGTWRAVTAVIDGDDLWVDGKDVRLLGLDAPEVDQPGETEARKYLRDLVGDNPVRLVTGTQREDARGRTLAYVYLPDGTFVNAEVVRAGYAQVARQTPKEARLDDLLAAEAEARAAGRGIWAPSDLPLEIVALQANAKGPDAINRAGETLVIENAGDAPVDLAGVSVADSANRRFVFTALLLAPGRQVRLHTGGGTATTEDVYWDRADPVWNNYGDAVFLRDPQGRLIDMYFYGLR